MNNQSVQSWADRTQVNQLAKFRTQWAATPDYSETKSTYSKPVQSNCFKALES